ncbi:MAG: TIGR04053 family radical SAM/SPASM domain-containing protein [Capsulimonadaceae bacterium]
MNQPAYTQADFEHSPFVMFYEVTRACDLRCKHCRACAQPNPNPHELTPEESLSLVDDIASFPKPPVLILTGGDPMKRADVVQIVRHSVSKGISTAMTPSATPLVTRDALVRLHEAGLSRLALSIDGVDSLTHDAFRGVDGSYDRTMEILRDAREIGLPLQVNTTLTQRNFGQLDEMADQFATLGIVLWSVFFLIPVGRGTSEHRIAPEQYEQAFESLLRQSQRQPYGIKTTEAPHYRRYALMRAGNPQHQPGGSPPPGRIQRAPLGVGDGKGVVFVSHTGNIYPSGFMPIKCGRFPEDSLVETYQNAPLLRDLRNPDLLHGKCGLCDFRHMCGGSRARSYAVTRDPLAAEPDCLFIPKALEVRQPCLV